MESIFDIPKVVKTIKVSISAGYDFDNSKENPRKVHFGEYYLTMEDNQFVVRQWNMAICSVISVYVMLKLDIAGYESYLIFYKHYAPSRDLSLATFFELTPDHRAAWASVEESFLKK